MYMMNGYKKNDVIYNQTLKVNKKYTTDYRRERQKEGELRLHKREKISWLSRIMKGP
jgi:hypothetical protein